MYGTIFGFTSVEQIPSFVFAREIKEIAYAQSYSSSAVYTKTDSLYDYFWALSEVEISSLLSSETWSSTTLDWWTRTPKTQLSLATGKGSSSIPTWSLAIRAGFQLA